jgi:hypothetical protein
VLDHGGDDRAPLGIGLERRKDGSRVGFGAAGGEHDLRIVRRAEEDCTWPRASLSALPTWAPKLWIDEALPNCSVKKGSMASTTAGSQAVVALLSM